MKRFIKHGWGLVLLTIGLLLFSAPGAQAWTFVVTETNDTTSLMGLRGAVIAANFLGGKNTILLGQPTARQRNHPPEWIYHLAIPGAYETNSRTGDLNVNRGDLTITAMSSNVIIDATGLGDRIFQVSPKAHLTLSGLVLRGGATPQRYSRFNDTETGAGGAIYNAGVLTLESCEITNNTSAGGDPDPNDFGGPISADAGGVYNSGTMSASNCVIAGNTASVGSDGFFGGNGGGLKNDGTSILSHCIISGNQCGSIRDNWGDVLGFTGWSGSGGGIFNAGTMILNECLVSDNLSGQGATENLPEGTINVSSPGAPGVNGGDGGGIYNIGQMQLNFSTVNGNITGHGGNGGGGGTGGNGGRGGDGAGIFNAGLLEANTSTISGNSAGDGGNGGAGLYDGGVGGTGGSGSAIYNGAPATSYLPPGAGTYKEAMLSLTSCTIALNQTGIGGNSGNDSWSLAATGGLGGSGGGILNTLSATNAIVRNSLIALNTPNVGGMGGTNFDINMFGSPGANGIGFDIAGDFTSQGFNLIGAADGSTGFTGGQNADQVGSVASPIDPEIGPLQMNGGPTPTHALLSGSPAIDQGNCFGIHTDQRGDVRPHIIQVSPEPPMPEPPGGDGSDIGAFEFDATNFK